VFRKGNVKPYYEDDLVTLYHGDCLEITEWLQADVLVTDPPYGVEWSERRGGYKGRGSYQPVPHAVKGDSSTEARDAAMAAWKPKPAVVFGSWKSHRPDGVSKRLIWDKAGSHPGPLNAAFYTADEEIYILGDGFRKSSPPQRSVIRTQEQRSAEVAKIGHPTPKPVGLMELLIGRCPPGAIADPFAGSGSTLVAARNLSRRAIGVELEEKYCELIAKRLSQQAFDLEGIA
jgi:DNA modification methylase